MDNVLFWVVCSCGFVVVGIYFFFVRSRPSEKTPDSQ
jgi:hypothetical protein